jgi:hypothetical protein
MPFFNKNLAIGNMKCLQALSAAVCNEEFIE